MPNICRFCRRKLTPRPDLIKGVEIDTFSPPRWKGPFGGYARARQQRHTPPKADQTQRDNGNRSARNRPSRPLPEAPCRKALLKQKAPNICNYPRLSCFPGRCTPVRSAFFMFGYRPDRRDSNPRPELLGSFACKQRSTN